MARARKAARDVALRPSLRFNPSAFLTPVPHRGQRNEPAYVRHVAEMIAQVKGLTVDVVAQQTTLNANQMLGW